MDELLRLLKNNAHTPVSDLAKELDMSEVEVETKIAAYEEDGTIVAYQAVLDPLKTGETSVTAMVEVRITPERGGGFDRLASRIAKFEEVTSCYLVSGGYDLLVIVQGKTLQDVATFIAEKLSTIKGVLSTGTHFRLKAYKENGALLVREARATKLAVAP